MPPSDRRDPRSGADGAFARPIPFAIRLSAIGALAFAAACSGGDAPPQADTLAVGAPDVPPRLLDAELPVRYPSEVYTRGVGGRVMLRLFIDSAGTVVPDSTRIENSSGVPELDSAAVRGVPEMHFTPAQRAGVPVAVPVLVPVDFPRADSAGARPAAPPRPPSD